MMIMNGGEPFYFPGGKTGWFLLHGFTGAPTEVRWLGEFLSGQGYSVLAPRLFAHATQPQDMVRARWRDWVASAEDGYYLLRDTCSQIILMGLSMGGSLALYLGANQPVSGVVAMSTPFVLPHRLARRLRPVIPIVSRIWRFASKGTSDWHDPEAERGHIHYNGYPLRGAAELFDLLAVVRQNLSRIMVPVLLMYSKGDRSVLPDHAEAILEALPPKDKSILWVENSGHVITRDAEREKVFTAASEFVRRVAS